MINIDARGKRCPRPIIELAKARREVPGGTIIDIVADDLAFETDVIAWCETTGNRLVALNRDGQIVSARIEINKIE